jgi:hypothetical protein
MQKTRRWCPEDAFDGGARWLRLLEPRAGVDIYNGHSFVLYSTV